MIQSNIHSAEQIATQMGRASDAIQKATSNTIRKAELTTLTVNKKAQDTNQQAMELAKLFNQAFQQTIQNIQSAAKEFEQMDKELGDYFNDVWEFLTEPINDADTYKKAKDG